MSDYDTLLSQVQASIDLANSLTQNPDDNYAACATALLAARDVLTASLDKSAQCLCPCHQGNPNWHALPCGCYSGNPILE
jgi:hypothetical protein